MNLKKNWKVSDQ